MKAMIAIRTAIMLVIGLMVIGVALWFLTQLVDFEAFLLSNDQRTLKQYATCALAYCASGAGSDEVNAVGCLKYESGQCVLSCAQVEEKVYEPNGVVPTVFEVGGRGAPHYCGKEAGLSFEFGDLNLGEVQLASGQMDRLATSPEWVCKPVKIPFLDVELDSLGIPTVEIQHGGAGIFPQNCIILSGKVSPIFPGREGCFLPIEYEKSRDDSYHTPLIQYDEPHQIIYPSAIYVDRSFTSSLDGNEPECEYRDLPSKPAPEEDVIRKVNELSDADTDDEAQEQKEAKFEKRLMGNQLSRCSFDVRHEGQKITYRVWAKPVYPTIDVLKEASGLDGFQNFVASMLGTLSDELKNGFIETAGIGEEGTRLVFSQLGGSCTSVVLSRDFEVDDKIERGEVGVSADVLVLSTDRKSYKGGDTVVISGTVDTENAETQSLPSKGRRTAESVRLEIAKEFGTLGEILVETERMKPDSDGDFEWQFQLRNETALGAYKVIARYGLEEQETEFLVK